MTKNAIRTITNTSLQKMLPGWVPIMVFFCTGGVQNLKLRRWVEMMLYQKKMQKTSNKIINLEGP